MPIDPRIALGYQAPQIESPINMMLTAQKMQAGQQENALRQAQMENYQAEVARRNALLPHEIAKAEREARAADIEMGSKQTAAQAAYHKQQRDILATINNRQMYAAWRNQYIAAQPWAAQYLPEPEQFTPEVKQQLLLTADKSLEYANRSLHFEDTGARAAVGFDPVTGEQKSQGVPKTAPPRAPMTAKEIADRDEAARVVAREVTDSAGNVRFFNKFGDEIKPGAGKGAGKPTATYEKTQNLRAQLQRDTDTAIAELTEISKDGGLIDQSTGSGAGRLIDKAAGFVGSETEGDLAIARLEPIADKILKMVPRFEGPQSDKDTQSYKEAAGLLADPTRTTARRKAAAKEILRLMKTYKGQFVTQEMASEGTTPAAPAAGGVDFSNPLLR